MELARKIVDCNLESNPHPTIKLHLADLINFNVIEVDISMNEDTMLPFSCNQHVLLKVLVVSWGLLVFCI